MFEYHPSNLEVIFWGIAFGLAVWPLSRIFKGTPALLFGGLVMALGALAFGVIGFAVPFRWVLASVALTIISAVLAGILAILDKVYEARIRNASQPSEEKPIQPLVRKKRRNARELHPEDVWATRITVTLVIAEMAIAWAALSLISPTLILGVN